MSKGISWTQAQSSPTLLGAVAEIQGSRRPRPELNGLTMPDGSHGPQVLVPLQGLCRVTCTEVLAGQGGALKTS